MQQKENIQLILGDCLEKMYAIEDNSIDLILCDLPYGKTIFDWDTTLPIQELWTHYHRILRPGRAILLFGMEPFSSLVRCSNLAWYRYDWIWEKNSKTGFMQAQNRPLNSYENISVFYRLKSDDTTSLYPELKAYMRDEKKKSGLTRQQIDNLLGNKMERHYFNQKSQFRLPSRKDYEKLQSTGYFQRSYEELLTIYEESDNIFHPQKTPSHQEPILRKGHQNYHERYVRTKTIDTWDDGSRYPTQILRYNLDYPRYHPAQKPVALLEYLIKTYTNENDIVLDNCMGSGSTGVACRNCNRRFIGIESNQDFYEISRKRILS